MATVYDRRRPDPGQGVFETLLAIDGQPVELETHLARLEASLDALYPTHDPPSPDVPSLMHLYGHSSDGTSRSLRVIVAPGAGGRLDAKVTQRSAPRPSEPSLFSVTVPGGLGAHKWADRSLLDEARSALSVDALPLVVDEDGVVLEASRANVFAVCDGSLSTPPLDGRILPGITRARVLELAEASGLETHETELRCDALHTADEVFLTGSVRGIERARSLDGKPLRSGGEITERLTAELWQSWTGSKTAL